MALPRAWAADGPYGALQAADANGIELPVGFTSRVVARSGQTVAGTSYVWHTAPDGGACFPVADGGWIYASNSEMGSGGGGVGVLRFSSDGSVVGAGRVLSGTNRNCSGGATPWGTWLSCEEISTGRVWECDPLGLDAAVARPAMGRFKHEAAAVDPVGRSVYLTEDETDGRLYRFRPSAWPDLGAGVLEVATVSDSKVTWSSVPDPAATATATRYQVAGSTAFNGGEGAWYATGKVWFTTKGDNRVWELDVTADPHTIRVIYDDNTSPNPVLTGVDNIVGSASGDLFVAEDGGNLELVLIEPDGATSAFLRVVNQTGSELAGPAFDPSGTRLYFSSQRGPTGTASGITYEVTGPFRPAPPTAATAAASDSFTRTVSNGWGNADVGGPYSVTPNGEKSFAVSNGVGTIALPSAGYGRSAHLQQVSARDVDVSASVSTDKAAQGGTWGQTMALVSRRVTSNTEYRTRLRFAPGGKVYLGVTKLAGTWSEKAVGAETLVPGTHSPGAAFMVRASVTGANPTTIAAKAWPAATAEPADWLLSVNDAESALQGPGAVGFTAYLSRNATNAPVVYSVDDYLVTSPG